MLCLNSYKIISNLNCILQHKLSQAVLLVFIFPVSISVTNSKNCLHGKLFKSEQTM